MVSFSTILNFQQFLFEFLSGGQISEVKSATFWTNIRFSDKALVKHVSKSAQVSSLKDCFKFCLDCINGVQNGCQCLSFNLVRTAANGYLLCEINKRSGRDDPQDLLSMHGYQYYEIN